VIHQKHVERRTFSKADSRPVAYLLFPQFDRVVSLLEMICVASRPLIESTVSWGKEEHRLDAHFEGELIRVEARSLSGLPPHRSRLNPTSPKIGEETAATAET
jgi:hypothetical protein